MSNDNVDTVVQDNVVKSEDQKRGKRGDVGKPTAALTLKQRWHNECFNLEKVGKRKVYVAKPGAPSLRTFARQLIQAGDQVAKDWFDHKKGSLNQERSMTTQKRITEEKNATKMARRKSKKQTGKKADAP
jgi:hypothetical protein